MHIRCRKHDRDEEDVSEEKSAERGETKIAKKNEEEQKESGKEREEARSEEGSDASDKTWLSWGPWANMCPNPEYQKEEASSSNRKNGKGRRKAAFGKISGQARMKGKILARTPTTEKDKQVAEEKTKGNGMWETQTAAEQTK